MSITPQQISTAEANQNLAAFDTHSQIRLIAGPGTGKDNVSNCGVKSN